MSSLILLIISAVLSIVFINFIPMGLKKKEKAIISAAVPCISSLGLLFSLYAAIWQAVLIMALLAVSVGYVIVTRSADKDIEKFDPYTRNQVENVKQGSLESEKTLAHKEQVSAIEEREIPLVNTSLANAIPFNQDNRTIEDDISFLEERSKDKQDDEFGLEQLDVIPVLNFEEFKVEETDKEKHMILHS